MLRSENVLDGISLLGHPKSIGIEVDSEAVFINERQVNIVFIGLADPRVKREGFPVLPIDLVLKPGYNKGAVYFKVLECLGREIARKSTVVLTVFKRPYIKLGIPVLIAINRPD